MEISSSIESPTSSSSSSSSRFRHHHVWMQSHQPYSIKSVVVLVVTAIALVIVVVGSFGRHDTTAASSTKGSLLLQQHSTDYDFPPDEITYSSNSNGTSMRVKAADDDDNYDKPTDVSQDRRRQQRRVLARPPSNATSMTIEEDDEEEEEVDEAVDEDDDNYDKPTDVSQDRRRLLVRPPSSAPTTFPFDLKYIDGIRYFNRPAKKTKKIDVFLLHSDSFTLKIWRSTGVLEFLCRHPTLGVTAVDLDAGSDYQALRNLLTSMANAKIIRLPVALVTPSASGWSVVTWMQNDPTTASDFFSVWIPVAPGAVKMASDRDIINLVNPPNNPSKRIRVLAIYGTGDVGGMRLSKRLGKLIPSATVVGLPGNHSVYRQSPLRFSETIAKFLGA